MDLDPGDVLVCCTGCCQKIEDSRGAQTSEKQGLGNTKLQRVSKQYAKKHAHEDKVNAPARAHDRPYSAECTRLGLTEI